MFLTGPSDTAEIVDRYETFRGVLAFDIGANAGWLSALLAEQFDAVVSCEPHPGSFEVLVANAPENVRPVNVAVSDIPGQVELSLRTISDRVGELFTPEVNLGIWGETVGSMLIDTITLDDLAETYGVPDFVKIDTEGHEMHVLNSGEAVFATGPKFLIEVHDQTYGDTAIRFLERHGLEFEVVRHERYRSDGLLWRSHFWLVSP